MTRAYKRYQTAGAARVPDEFLGIQVNVCRNVTCTNFAIPPLVYVSKGKNPSTTDGYRMAGVKNNKGQNKSTMLCKLCGQSFTIKSNAAVAEELDRQRAPFLTSPSKGCRTVGCINEGQHPVGAPKSYQAFGSTLGGSKRYRCKACNSTFSIPRSATLRQRLPEKTSLIARLLINKMPMRRICEAASVRPAVLYNRIDFLHRQAQRLRVYYEQQLVEGKKLPRLRIAVDRQDHVFNWSSGGDRRNTQLSAVGSADCDSGYVFSLQLDYDPNLKPFDIDLHAREIGDYDLAPPFRRYAHLFLPGDYQMPGEAPADCESLDLDARLPTQGMRIHSEYVLFAHFHYLKWLLPGAECIHFYLDQEPSIRGACMNAFSEKVVSRHVEAFFVRIAKNMTVDEKKLELARSETYLAKMKSQFPGMSGREIAVEIMLTRYQEACAAHQNPMNRWVESILPHMGEPRKSVCHLTARIDDDPRDVARAMLKASLHPIDRFFMQIRRRVSLLERPIATASSAGRIWHGYSGYNPNVSQKIMETFRIFYNYCLLGKDQQTPAMRLGLTNEVISLEDILRFI